MSSVNKVILVGNLGRDPEMRSTQQGNRIATFSMAMGETWRDKASGERKERTEWANIVIFNERLAEVAEKYLKKGSKIYVEGKYQTRTWEKDGVKHYTTEVVLANFDGKLVMLDGPAGGSRGGSSDRGDDYDDGGQSQARTQTRGSGGGSAQRGPRPGDDDLDSEIPF